MSRAGCNERLGEAGCLICKSGPIWTNYTAIICLFLQDKCSNVREIRRSLPGLLLEETAIIARPTSGSLKQQRFESRAEQSLVAINKGQGVKKLWTSKTWMVSLENTSEILVCQEVLNVDPLKRLSGAFRKILEAFLKRC